MKRIGLSVAQKFGGPGSSGPLTRVRDALVREFGEAPESPSGVTVLSGGAFPEFVDQQRLGDGLGPAFDDRAQEEWLAMGGALNLLVGGGGASLSQMACFDESVTLWFSSHFDYANRVLGEEYRSFGIQKVPVHPYLCWRANLEQERSRLMVVPSEACRATYPERLREKIRVVEFGVDGGRFRPGPPRLEGGPLRVLFPATNPPRKGLRYVLQAWARLPRDEFQLTITGVNLQGASLGLPSLAPPVLAAGWVSDAQMVRLYQEHDVLLLPSLEEGQALAALEAMSCGVPVIVTPNVGLPDPTGEFGFEVQPHESEEITVALNLLAGDRDLLVKLGEGARAEALRRPWSGFEDGIVRVVREVLG